MKVFEIDASAEVTSTVQFEAEDEAEARRLFEETSIEWDDMSGWGIDAIREVDDEHEAA